MENKTIRLQAGTKEFEISKKAALLSELLKSTMNDYPEETAIPLGEIDEKSTEKVLEYLTHYNGESPCEIEKPLKSKDMKDVTDEWSALFVDKMTIDELVQLTIAANYMGINSLIDLSCAKLASICKDKEQEEIFKVFNINETFTEEEKDTLRQENKWIEENL